jgi:hypothetical protein
VIVMYQKPTVPSCLILSFTLVLHAALLAACARREASPAPAAAAPGPSSARGASPASLLPPPNANTTAPSRGTLADRLAAEGAARPRSGPHVEEVTAALRSAGVSVGSLTQVLGRTIGARYCASTATAAGVAVAVCEFSDDAEAARGLEYSHRQFDRLVPGRTLLRNRGTVLTLTPGEAGRAPAPDTSRAAAVFASL